MIPRRDTGYGVKGLVLCAERVLLLRKPSGQYDLPGGRLERGERDKDGLRREILEETGIEKIDITDTFVPWSFTKQRGFKVKGTTWVCHFDGGTVSLSFEHSSYTWAPLNQLRDLDIFRKFGLHKLGSHRIGQVL